MSREILLLTHPSRPDVRGVVAEAADLLAERGLAPVIAREELDELGLAGHGSVRPVELADPLPDVELVLVLGGDGTILRGAEVARRLRVPVLGINFGRVGFLAEAEREDLTDAVQRIAAREYHLEERLTLEVVVTHDGVETARTWALNEVSIEKTARERLLELTVEVDARPLSTWSGDGLVVATPTGSTAYAFSAGGPILWPDVEALLVVPLSAHALFARPVVLGPGARVAVDVVRDAPGPAVMWCDGRRTHDLAPGSRIEVVRSPIPVTFARLRHHPFTDRLVEKFRLPVSGWRGAAGPGPHAPGAGVGPRP